MGNAGEGRWGQQIPTKHRVQFDHRPRPAFFLVAGRASLNVRMEFWRITKWAQMDPQTPTGRHTKDVTSHRQRCTHSSTQWTNSDPPPPTVRVSLGHDYSRSRVPFYFPTRAKRRRLHDHNSVTMPASRSSTPSTISSPSDLPRELSEVSDQHPEDTIMSRCFEREPSQDPETYPSTPTSDATTGDTSPATTTDQRDQTTTNTVPPSKDFYPASAYGPQGPKGYKVTSQAGKDTMAMAASGQSNDSDSSHSDHTEEHASKRGLKFFSEPPMPVYHNQPQSAASYYPGSSFLADNHDLPPIPM